MSDIDATQARQDVVAEVDEIIEHVINANMLNMPYHVYSELFDAVDGLGVGIENLQAENAELRKTIGVLVYCIDDGDCDGCAINGSEDKQRIDKRTFSGCDTLIEMLRNVGIEVDE